MRRTEEGGLQEETRASSQPEGPRAPLAKGATGYHVRLLRAAGTEEADIPGQTKEL